MATTTARRAKMDAAAEELRSRGAELLKAENRWGETKTGWWLDGTWIGPKSDPAHALRIINGGG